MKLKDILATTIYELAYMHLTSFYKEHIDDACARIEHTWEGASNRLPWHDFCSTEEEKPVYDVKWFRCSACGDEFMSGQNAKPNYCSNCGKKWQELHPPETVDGILNDLWHSAERLPKCSLYTWKKRLCDHLIAALNHGKACGTCAMWYTAERVLRRELGGENE